MTQSIAAFVAAAALLGAAAPQPLPGQAQYTYWVDDEPLSCTIGGRPIPIFIDNSLDDVGIARIFPDGRYYIAINDDRMQTYEPIVQIFIFAHECGHHLGPTMGESWADCVAAKELRRLGYVTTFAQVATIMRSFEASPGSPMGHLPGPYRAELIRQCSA
jgi:hypothetical protein